MGGSVLSLHWSNRGVLTPVSQVSDSSSRKSNIKDSQMIFLIGRFKQTLDSLGACA